MRCPYHPERQALLHLPGGKAGAGWIGWMQGCCGLPAWVCPQGDLHPIDARYCQYHACARPDMHHVNHEVAHGDNGTRDVPAPGAVVKKLTFAPSRDGRSTPCVAGNLLVYLSEENRLVAIDLGSERHLFLAQGISAVALALKDGHVVGALQTRGGVRYHAWEVRALREGLDDGLPSVPPRMTSASSVHLLGLPLERSRRHVGVGMMRLVVEHDPMPSHQADLYESATGGAPGDWLIRRPANPMGPAVPYPDLRPQVLHQVPVPVPGGVLMLGQTRVFGKDQEGALLLPLVGGYVA